MKAATGRRRGGSLRSPHSLRYKTHMKFDNLLLVTLGRITMFVEVLCRSSGKVRRFAAGTTAGYALYVINCKLDIGVAPGLHIEAVKEGEEPVVFGPNSILVNYGKGWNLQTVTDEGHDESIGMLQNSKKSPNFQSFKKPMTMNQPNSTISFQYIGKILLAFAFMFLLGGIFTFFLENLPAMNLSAVSSL